MYEEELLKRMKHKVDDTDIESQTNTTKKMNNGMEARNLNYSKLDDESDSDDASSSDSSRSSFDSSYEDSSSSSSSSSSHSDNDESNEDEEKDQPEQEKASTSNGQVVEDKNPANQDSTNVKPNGVAIEIKDSASTGPVYNAPTDTEKTLPENTSTESKSEKMKKKRDCEYIASLAYRDLHGIIVLQSACLYVCVIYRLFNSQQRSSQGLCFFRLILKY